MTKENTDFSQTVLQQFEDIAAIVEQYETRKNHWGDDVPRFYLADIQDNEVITVDTGENYHYYGFPFSINGDKPEIDFASCGKRKKLRYENYEDGASVTEGAFDFGKYIENVEATAFAKVDEAEKSKSEVETEFAEVKANYDEIKPKYDEYVQAEAQREADELNAQKKKVNPEFLNKYLSKQEGKVFPIFVELKDNRCGGCRMEVPAGKLKDLNTKHILECENCGRIIYKL